VPLGGAGSTGVGGSLELVQVEFGEGGEEVRSALEWAQVRALVADGMSEREIARRLGINRRTVRRLAEADEPPRYERSPAGSMLDPLEPVIRKLIEECPEIKAPRVTETLRDDYGYGGSVDLVRKRMAALRPSRGERGAAHRLQAGAGDAG
jgi:transposase